jgi:hypothetical protein
MTALCLSQLEQQLRVSAHDQGGEGWTLTLPIQVKNGCNLREHPMARHRRVLKEHKIVAQALWARELLNKRHRPSFPPYVVTMTRIAARKLDDDNMVAGFKGVRDAVAKWLGVNDGDTSKVRWVYAPEEKPPRNDDATTLRTGKRSAYACRIQIEGATT